MVSLLPSPNDHLFRPLQGAYITERIINPLLLMCIRKFTNNKTQYNRQGNLGNKN
ncbi:hypothetical protein Pan181_31200 [Aeoliella mucimassa]|uniref:Uncharacterized protein n=1 Tax=Aeoliella mucimassa TaxID=2527972 RepID=A0A518AQB1_9BACT|nr:hypothetical protein Pan181_31200 [Aeoliella mucimassa]